jgi:regulator of sigma E protease
MNAKSPGQRAFFLAAGSGMNFLLAILLMILVVGVQGVANANVYIAAVEPGSPAARAGWKEGDQLVEVAGRPVEDTAEIASTARDYGGRPMSVVIERRGKTYETIVTPRKDPPKDQGPTGVGLSEQVEADIFVTDVTAGTPAEDAGLLPGDRIVSVNDRAAVDRFVVQTELRRFTGFAVPVVVERDNATRELSLAVPRLKSTEDPIEAVGFGAKVEPIFEDVPAARVIPRGFSEAWDQTRQMVNGIKDLVTGEAPLDQVAGPIGMGQITSEVIEVSPLPLWVTLAQLSILLSLNLGVLNLLPLPALDGGRLLFVLVEVLRGGRRIAPEKEGLVHFAGLVLLLGFMFVVAFVDVGRLLDGESFLP